MDSHLPHRQVRVAPLLQDPPVKGRQEQILRDLAAKTYRIPGSPRTQVSLTTLRRYLKAYRSGGFEALRPPPRADRDAPRAFPTAVLDRAIQLREEQPARTTATPAPPSGACAGRTAPA